MTRPLVPFLALALLTSGCSSESPPPVPAKAEAGGVAASPVAAKGKKPRPGQQDPGSASYEDKPGARTRGR